MRRGSLVIGFVSMLLGQLNACATRPVQLFALNGLWHKVEPGDTIDAVAKRYGADQSEIAELNDLASDAALGQRSEIFVPKKGGQPPGRGALPPAPFIQPHTEAPVAQTSAQPSAQTKPAPKVAKPGKKGATGKTNGQCQGSEVQCLAWPIQGAISLKFGSSSDSHHEGIDIAAPAGTPIKAAAKGQVLYSGAKIKGYGNLIIMRHDKVMVTVYAHNEANLVQEGDKVERGQTIAKVGNTGSASSFHLHFEVRVNEQPQDPLLYLEPEEKK